MALTPRQSPARPLPWWSIWLRFAALIFIFVVVGFIISVLGAGPYMNAWDRAVYPMSGGFIFSSILFISVWILTRMDRTSLAHAGLGGGWKAPLLFVGGALLWAIPFIAMSLALKLNWYHALPRDWDRSASAHMTTTFLGMLSMFVLPIMLVFVGYLVGLGTRLRYPWLWVLTVFAIPALLFFWITSDWGSSAAIILIGTIISGLRLSTGSIWMPLGFVSVMITCSELLRIQTGSPYIGDGTGQILAMLVAPMLLAAAIGVSFELARRSRRPNVTVPPGSQVRL